ncbi:MAG: lytic transglycosylase domain-containing protein [Spirochaetia bacterium]|nr:lytic transglycosylase domain-containing protein [Spirochaetia bacterium]
MLKDTVLRVAKPVFATALLAAASFLGGACSKDDELSYVPSGFAAMSDIPSEGYAAAMKSLERADHISHLYMKPTGRDLTLAFFSALTGSQQVAKAILDAAVDQNVPPALAFALAYEESHYKTAAVGHNADSVDRGLFQLNSKSFPSLSSKDFFDPVTNAEHGVSHLAYFLKAGGNEVAALAMYNAGQTRVSRGGTPRKTLDYIFRITNYRANLEALFEAQVVAKMEVPEGMPLLALADRPERAPNNDENIRF